MSSNLSAATINNYNKWNDKYITKGVKLGKLRKKIKEK